MADARDDRDLGALAVFAAATATAAGIGGAATAGAVRSDWYRELEKPSWQPPQQAFGPVWTALYAQSTWSAWRVHRAARRDPALRNRSRAALAAWGVHLGLNAAWSIAFFGRRSIRGGLAVIVPLWLSVAATAVLSARVEGRAGVAYAPYLAWVAVATALNERIRELNPDS